MENESVKTLLRKHLKENFPKKIIDRGKQYYVRKVIKSITPKNDDNVYLAKVAGSEMYNVRLSIHQKTQIITSSCSCPYGENCKHVAAVITLVMEENHFINNGNQPLQPKPSVNKYTIEKGKSSDFRKIYLEQGSDISKYTNKNARNYYQYYEFTVYLNHENIIMLESKSYYYGDFSTQLKFENQNWYIKCDNCNEISNKFCTHQNTLFTEGHIINNIIAFIDRKLDFTKVLAQFFNIKEADVATIGSNFRIYYNPSKGFYLTNPQDNFILSDENLYSDYLIYEDPKSDEDLESKDRFVYHSLTKRNLTNGLCFSRDYEIIFLEGKLNKTGTKLASGIEETSFPKYLDLPSKEFFKNIEDAQDNQTGPITIFNVLNINFLKLKDTLCYYIENSFGGDKKFRKSDLKFITFVEKDMSLHVRFDRSNVTTKLISELKNNKTTIPIEDIDWFGPYFFVVNEKAYLFSNIYIDSFLTAHKHKEQMVYVTNNKNLEKSIKTNLSKFAYLVDDQIKVQNLRGGAKQIFIRQYDDVLIFEPKIKFEQAIISPYGLSQQYLPDSDELIHYDEAEIKSYIAQIQSLHESWVGVIPSMGLHSLGRSSLNISSWFLDFFEKCNDFNIEVFGQDKLTNLNFNKHKAKVTTRIASGIDWFEANVDLSFGDIKADHREWVDAIKTNSKYVKLSDGTLGVIPDNWIQKLKKILAAGEVTSDKINISKMRFNIIDELFEDIDDVPLAKELAAKKKALASYDKNKKYTIPKNEHATLRPYQIQGFQWMKFLEEYNFGGCLADDMGLGKTVQVITFLLDQKLRNKGVSLVVVPKSLLFNWEAELKKFAPSIEFVLHHGNNRMADLDHISKVDIIISTYDTVSNDIQMFKAYRFNYIILDESQAIKNIESQRYKSMRLLQSDNKLVMTGTPIENNTFDLYAQMNFLNPGILGTQASFRNNFAVPIDGQGDKEVSQVLKNILHPFMLRRTKSLVAKDLPEKSESIIICEMGDAQRKMYDTLRAKIQKDITTKVNQDGTNNAKFMILDGLLRLRQVCNSPELVDANLPDKKKTSVKIDTLIEMLVEDLGQHKALVYSQFVGMLALIRKKLEEKNIKYAYLDGSTNDRGSAVSDFMDNDDCHVFLLSIKAGNAGLNLTKADYVYIVDPWWNPAVEAQAIDRTHRIGQKNNVMAYRMICKDTIEEKIVELQKKKRALATDLIQTDENVFKSLEKDELLALFE